MHYHILIRVSSVQPTAVCMKTLDNSLKQATSFTLHPRSSNHSSLQKKNPTDLKASFPVYTGISRVNKLQSKHEKVAEPSLKEKRGRKKSNSLALAITH